jgi:hypothetical protein
MAAVVTQVGQALLVMALALHHGAFFDGQVLVEDGGGERLRLEVEGGWAVLVKTAFDAFGLVGSSPLVSPKSMGPAKFVDRHVTKEQDHRQEKFAIPCHSRGHKILAQRVPDISPEQEQKGQRRYAKQRKQGQLKRHLVNTNCMPISLHYSGIYKHDKNRSRRPPESSVYPLIKIAIDGLHDSSTDHLVHENKS